MDGEEVGGVYCGARRVKMYEYAVPKSSDARAEDIAREMMRRSPVTASSADGVCS